MRTEGQIQFQNFKYFCISTATSTDCGRMRVKQGTLLRYGSGVHQTLLSVNSAIIPQFAHNSTDTNHCITASSLSVMVAVRTKA
jgi:hypothetical protein